jgi:hypothetical protein
MMAPVANLCKPVSVIIRQMMEILRALLVAKLISCSILLVCHLTTVSVMINYLYLPILILIRPC